MPDVSVDHGGRGGDVLWRDGEVVLRFAWEGTAYGYEIGVPTRDEWTALTGLPASRRDGVLRELGEAFVQARAPHGRWALVESRWSCIEIHA